MTKWKKTVKVICFIIAALIVLLLIVYINHQVRLKKEEALRSPLGQIVEVDDHDMSVYIEGTGDTTLVFMSGGGTCSPILDFKSLYSLLSDKYKIVVVEKFGYGRFAFRRVFVQIPCILIKRHLVIIYYIQFTTFTTPTTIAQS